MLSAVGQGSAVRREPQHHHAIGGDLHIEKPLATEDRSHYRRKSMTVTLAASIGSLVSTAQGWLAPFAIAAPEALLLAAGTVKAQKSAKTQE